jgi:hypothetical protein
LIDIIVLLAMTFLLDAALGAFVQVPIDLGKGFVLDAIVKVLLSELGADWFCYAARDWPTSD